MVIGTACGPRLDAFPGGLTQMCCKLCGSLDQRKFPSEINFHFPGMENSAKPTVWVFPTLCVCLDCGFTEFVVDEGQLVRLQDDIPPERMRNGAPRSKQSHDVRLKEEYHDRGKGRRDV